VSPSAKLVTGGAGYVALRHSGYTPVDFDNLSTDHKSLVRWGPFVPGDIGDTDAVRHTIGAYQVEAVLHFAASPYVRGPVADPEKYCENNVAGLPSLETRNFALQP
jgi:UDP-arabinose 4-epimerase